MRDYASRTLEDPFGVFKDCITALENHPGEDTIWDAYNYGVRFAQADIASRFDKHKMVPLDCFNRFFDYIKRFIQILEQRTDEDSREYLMLRISSSVAEGRRRSKLSTYS